MALSIPKLPIVSVWHVEQDERYERVVKLLADVKCETHFRNLLESRPSADELARVASYVDHGPSTLISRAVCQALGIDWHDGPAIAEAIAEDPTRIRGPLVLSNRQRAIVARPPEFCYAVLAPEMPEGESAGSMMRRVLQGKLTS